MHCNKTVFTRSPCLLGTASLSGEQYSFRQAEWFLSTTPAEHLPRDRTSGGAVAFPV
jgi:hypothetical protein